MRRLGIALFGLVYGAFCGIMAWLVSQSERGKIKGETWDKIMSVFFGIVGAVIGGAAIHDFGWRGIPLALVCALVFFGIGACGAAL